MIFVSGPLLGMEGGVPTSKLVEIMLLAAVMPKLCAAIISSVLQKLLKIVIDLM